MLTHATGHRHLRDGLAGLRGVVDVDDSAHVERTHKHTRVAHMLVIVCSSKRHRASDAPEARSHTQAQGCHASTEGYDRSRGDNTANGQHTLVCGHVYVWRKTGPTVESCVRLRDTHLQRARRALVVIDTDGGGLGLRFVVLEWGQCTSGCRAASVVQDVCVELGLAPLVVAIGVVLVIGPRIPGGALVEKKDEK